MGRKCPLFDLAFVTKTARRVCEFHKEIYVKGLLQESIPDLPILFGSEDTTAKAWRSQLSNIMTLEAKELMSNRSYHNSPHHQVPIDS